MNRLLLVDACNVLMRNGPCRAWLDEGGLQAGLERLVEAVRILHDTEGIETHFIVDGQGPGLSQTFPGNERTLSILYAPRHQTADTVIEAWLMRLGGQWNTTVVTADRAIAHTALAHGAEVIQADELLQWATRCAARSAHVPPVSKNVPPFGNSLENYFKNR